MKLSEISWLVPMIHQDGEFSGVGHPLGHGKSRIVAITSEDEIKHCLKNEDIVGVVVSNEYKPLISNQVAIIISSNPILTVLKIQNEISKNTTIDSAIHRSAKIHSTARISDNVSIGKRVIISEYVTIEDGTWIGNDVFIGPNTRIGSLPDIPGISQEETHHFAKGTVEIGSRSYIQSNSIIERSLFSETTQINTQCFIDSQAVIRQGVQIGSGTLLAAIVTIEEFSTIGRECWAGPRSKICPGVTIGDTCYITLGSTVSKNMGSGMIVRDNWGIRKDRFSGIIP
jgi:UDP-3-O-[3-hydroxymyristoyl] glucosamine N-acyltransferase